MVFTNGYSFISIEYLRIKKLNSGIHRLRQ